MKANTPLKIIVELYRISGKPAITSFYLPLTINFCPAADQLMKEFISCSNFSTLVDEDEFSIDGVQFQSLLPSNWKTLTITVKLPRNNIHRFHSSVSELISFSSVRNGDFPDDFYIIDLDFYSNDAISPALIFKVQNICRLIKSLSKLAHYHDKKATDGEPRLVFIQGSEGRSKSSILQPTITEDMLNLEDFDCTIVEQLQNEYSMEDVNHHLEKRGIFRNSLVEFTNDNNYDFAQLVEHWTDFRLAYDNNLSVYLSGFNFHKARKEVALAELEFAEKTSKTISDLTSKILAIPISLLAALGIWKLSDITEQSVIFIGVFFTSLIIHLIISSQKKQLKRIIHSKEMVFNPFTLKLKNYPGELQGDINKAINQLQNNETFSFRILLCFYFLSWTPTIVGISIILYKYNITE